MRLRTNGRNCGCITAYPEVIPQNCNSVRIGDHPRRTQIERIEGPNLEGFGDNPTFDENVRSFPELPESTAQSLPCYLSRMSKGMSPRPSPFHWSLWSLRVPWN
jgi:hypothetical protein